MANMNLIEFERHVVVLFHMAISKRNEFRAIIFRSQSQNVPRGNQHVDTFGRFLLEEIMAQAYHRHQWQRSNPSVCARLLQNLTEEHVASPPHVVLQILPRCTVRQVAHLRVLDLPCEQHLKNALGTQQTSLYVLSG